MNNPSLEYIESRLSLRKPQKESLEILDDVIEYVISEDTNTEKLRKIKTKYNYFSSFDRDFPSLCFSLATGVGKTRLMGAFIAYLYIVRNIKNFMVIAPNITIYNKLKSDFSDESSEKYVFKGLKEFVQNQPKIVTGENYKEQGKQTLWESEITINIFNIDKINKEEQSIKSLSEYLGQSYYDFLIEQDSLVVLMDESHHYRADRGMKVLNELNPILGLELTATPQIEKNNRTIKFGNIIYDYPLSKAMIDGYVKEPSVATKKNFNASNFDEEHLDKIKLADGIAIHENTKVALENYAKNNDAKLIKPFVMVICKNIEHANAVMNYIKSDEFYNGYYKNKSMMITSKDGNIEKDENVQKLLQLENTLNKIEIVVHVNMLKEGWDVNNLYTIIPLRRSASQTLTEQTMGRGLRLPYGCRMGDEAVDRLTIVSHDKYQEIIDEANKESSILKASNIIFIEDMNLKAKESVSAIQTWEDEYNKLIDNTESEAEKNKLIVTKEIKKLVSANSLNKINLESEITKEEILSNIEKSDDNSSAELELIYESIISNDLSNIINSEKKDRINIPYVSANENTKIEQDYKDFSLDYSEITFKPLDNNILIRHLGDGADIEIKVGNVVNKYKSAKEILMDKIYSISNLDYEKCSDIINCKLDEYISFLKSRYSEDDVLRIIYDYSNYIVRNISKQILNNMSSDIITVSEKNVKEYSPILNPSFIKNDCDEIKNFKLFVEKSEIKKTIFNGFKKACHNMYKFDSSTEKDFSIILENSVCVIKWLRPAEKQFNIYWNRVNRYEPDFIVETDNYIYMVEIKAKNQVNLEEVQLKKKAAENYCNAVNEYRKRKKSVKEWKYLLIKDDDVKINYDFNRYI